MTRPSTDKLVDEFVSRLNASDFPRLASSDVPEFLRTGATTGEDFVAWKIRPAVASRWLDPVEARLPRPFPPSFRSLVMRYAFPAFDLDRLHLFANTGDPSVYEELATRVFRDPVMSPVLLKNGFVQIGELVGYGYDPLCVDMNERKGGEYPLVLLDHETALQTGKIEKRLRVAESFGEVLNRFLDER